MPAGKRRYKITIQKSTMADDTSGQPLPTWANFCTRFADVEATSGSERFRGRQITAQMTHVIQLLSDSVTKQITPGMRVLWQDRIIDLVVVKNLDGNWREIQLQGVEIVGA